MTIRRGKAIAFLVLFLTAVSPVPAGERIRLSTTTSADNSGLLDVLLPPFEKKFNVKIDVIAVGTGKALALAANGDVDVVLVHSPKAEDAFLDSGDGINRRRVMHNDFVLLGASRDPARIKASRNILAALQEVFETRTPFVSRGDGSGTHKKELSLWQEAELSPEGKWYIETGQGMGATLLVADEKRAYVFVDRGTYIAYRKKIGLVIICEGDASLVNPYSIIAVNPAKHPHVKHTYAMALIGWMTSAQGQKIIRDYRINGEALFCPDAVKR